MRLARRGDIVQIATLFVTPTQDAAVIRTSIQKTTSVCKVSRNILSVIFKIVVIFITVSKGQHNRKLLKTVDCTLSLYFSSFAFPNYMYIDYIIFV